MRFSFVLLATVLVCVPLKAAEKPAAEKPAAEKPAAEKPAFTGAWKGTFTYPAGSGKEPVPFTAVLVEKEGDVRGVIVEPNTFGAEMKEPSLHAEVLDGRLNQETREVRFTKSYVGTDQVSHDVEYRGSLSADGTQVTGSWTISDASSADFKMEKIAETRAGPLSGLWTGTYRYAETDLDENGNPRPPVPFEMVVVHKDKGLWGYVHEERTFGEGSSPRLFAVLEGTCEQFNRQGDFHQDLRRDG